MKLDDGRKVLLRDSAHLALLVIVSACAAAIAIPSTSKAQESSTAVSPETRFAGTYKYGKSLDHGRAIVRRAMEKAIDQISFIYRGIARRRLASSDPLVHRIEIAFPEKQISVKLIGAKQITFATPPGVTTKVQNLQGKQVDLTQRFVKGSLEQVFVGPKGRSRALYTLLPDDRSLVINTTMKGQQLESPITYQLTYKKQ